MYNPARHSIAHVKADKANALIPAFTRLFQPS